MNNLRGFGNHHNIIIVSSNFLMNLVHSSGVWIFDIQYKITSFSCKIFTDFKSVSDDYFNANFWRENMDTADS